MKGKTITEKIYEKIDKLKVGEFLSKPDIVIEIYGYNDYFVTRSFDVSLHKAKILLSPKKFDSSRNKIITRIK